MGRPAPEVADIFRLHGPAWRQAQRGHLSLGQLKVMSAIEQCRSAALGGHLLRCEGCHSEQIAYNSCRNRHCPKCQGSAARRWLQARGRAKDALEPLRKALKIEPARRAFLVAVAEAEIETGDYTNAAQHIDAGL